MSRKKIGILQPVYLPWLGYFEQLALADHFVFLDDVQYTRQDWRNRNRILTKSGPIWLNVPVSTAGLGTPINEVTIDYSKNWQKKHVRSIWQHYHNAPHFQPIFDEISSAISSNGNMLLQLDVELTLILAKHLNVETETSFASDIPVRTEFYDEHRTSAPKDRIFRRNMRLIEICLHHEANLFYEGAKGSDYIDIALFGEYGIEVVFQDYRHMDYPQCTNIFYSHMSAIDLIMNVGPDAQQILLSSPVPSSLAASLTM
jgi:WbqC-like protein family